MCTLIVLDRVVPRVPLVVASNRDEYLSRPAAPPALVRAEGPEGIPRVAPQDLEAGGTWMGVNARGLFVGLTNRPSTRRDRNRRSRGKLVMDALGYEDAE
ncbi:MAG: NRDE family protein, partial [Myxococcota bacterium]